MQLYLSSYGKCISIMMTNETNMCMMLSKLTDKRRESIIRKIPKALLLRAMALL